MGCSPHECVLLRVAHLYPSTICTMSAPIRLASCDVSILRQELDVEIYHVCTCASSRPTSLCTVASYWSAMSTTAGWCLECLLCPCPYEDAQMQCHGRATAVVSDPSVWLCKQRCATSVDRGQHKKPCQSEMSQEKSWCLSRSALEILIGCGGERAQCALAVALTVPHIIVCANVAILPSMYSTSARV